MFISSAWTHIFLSNVVFIYLFEHPYFQIFARLVQKVNFICELIFHLLSWLSFMVFDFFICSYTLGFWFTGSLWLGAFDFALGSVFLSSFLSGGFIILWSYPQDQSRTGLLMATVNLCSSLIWGSCRLSHRVDSLLGCEAVIPLLPPQAYSFVHSSLELVSCPFFQPPFTSKMASLQSPVSAESLALSSLPCATFQLPLPHRLLALALLNTSQFSFLSAEMFILFFGLFMSY